MILALALSLNCQHQPGRERTLSSPLPPGLLCWGRLYYHSIAWIIGHATNSTNSTRLFSTEEFKNKRGKTQEYSSASCWLVSLFSPLDFRLGDCEQASARSGCIHYSSLLNSYMYGPVRLFTAPGSTIWHLTALASSCIHYISTSPWAQSKK